MAPGPHGCPRCNNPGDLGFASPFQPL